MIGRVKAWLVQRFGRQFGEVTPAQLRALAVAALRGAATAMANVEHPAAPLLRQAFSLAQNRGLGLPNGAPEMHLFRNEQPMKAHPDYATAKAGDLHAAVRMVSDLVKPDFTAAAAKVFGSDVEYVAVAAQELSGRNKNPTVLAAYLAGKTGATVARNIAQANRAYHTGASAMERLAHRAAFGGLVEPGKRYVLVDDVTVMGSTLADLANFIRANGGEVAGSVVLVNQSRSGVLAATASHVRDIKKRFGHGTIENLIGIAPAGLTGPETEYIRNFRNADALRVRLAAAGNERGERLRLKGVQGSTADAQAGLKDNRGEITTDGRAYSIAARRRMSSKIGQYIDAIARGKENKGLFVAGETPDVLSALGLSGDHLTITPDVVWKAIDKHGLTPADIKAAIADAYNPLMVFRHDTGSLNSVGRTFDHHGRPMVLSASVWAAPSKKIVVTDIRTIHGKDGTGFIAKWIDEGKLKYWDKSGTGVWLSSTQANSGRITTQGYVVRLPVPPKKGILQPADVFKPVQEDTPPEGSKYSLNIPTEAVTDWAKGKSTDLTPALLATVPLNYFSELKRPNMLAVDRYLKIKRDMDTYRGNKNEAMVQTAEDWRKFAATDRKGADRLAAVMHEATIAGFDPENTTAEPGNREQQRLSDEWGQLPRVAKELYRRVRHAYSAMQDEIEQIILTNIDKAHRISEHKAEQAYQQALDKAKRDPTITEAERRDQIELWRPSARPSARAATGLTVRA